MMTYDKNNIRLLPLYFNLLQKSESPKFEYQAADKQLIKQLVEEVKKSNDNGTILAIDMQYVSVFGTKTDGNEGPFEELGRMKDSYNFCLFNLQKSPPVLDLILSDMKIKEENVIYYDICSHSTLTLHDDNRTALVASNTYTQVKLGEFNSVSGLWGIYTSIIADVLKSKCIDSKLQYLPSSDIYSDTYIRIKDLFLYPQYTSICIYLLCKLIRDNFSHTSIDYIVSMSNTGAILANLVGKMLNKKVLFCTNVGPQFALDLNNLRSKVERGANYLYIYDFICLGTEIKNLRSILICHDAKVIGGVGIASLPSTSKLRASGNETEEFKSFLKNAYSIVTLNEHGIPYRISTIKEELKKRRWRIRRRSS